MAWKEIYNPGSSSFIAKVPSNSIYYSKPKMLIDLYRTACRNSNPDGELKFGNGWLNYKNTGTHETLEVYLYLLDRVFKGLHNCSFSLHFDYNKKMKMYEYYLVPSMCCQAATNYVKEHIKCPKEHVQSVYASDVGEDLFGYIKGIILDVQKAIYDYVMIYENGNLEFEIEHVEDIEKIKELAISLGYTFHLGDHDTHGKEIVIFDGTSLNLNYDNKIVFVSSPCGLWKTEGDFEYIASIMGYKAEYGEAKFKFKSPKDMFSFIKDMLIQYHEVKTKLLSVRPQFEEHILKV